MRLKTYRAPTTPAAIALVRAELGPDALILATKRAGNLIEVTAALERPAPPLPEPESLRTLAWHAIPPQLAATLGSGRLDRTLAQTLRFCRLDLSAGSSPILLAGPPGAGKSLTCAKLATRLVLDGKPPLVVSADGARAGATEQLAAFTRLLGLPLVVATDPLALARAVSRRSPGQPVLIDSAGIDPLRPADQAGIATLAASSGARTVVVLPAGHDAAESADAAAAFVAAGASLMLPTRLDAARRLGGILAAAAAGLALTEAGCGPGVADGLLPLTPECLASRLVPPSLRRAA